MKHFFFWSFFLFFVIAIPFQETHAGKNMTDSSPIYGGIFRMNFTEDFLSLYPLSIYDDAGINIGRQIYEGLVKFDPQTLKIIPCLAESWEADTSFRRWTFHLRNNIYFQDDVCFPAGKGRKLTANDVKFCFQKACEETPESFFYRTFTGIIKGAEEYHLGLDMDVSGFKAINDSTFSIETITPCHYLTEILTTPFSWIFPKEALDKYGDDMRIHPVGTGPFFVKKITEGDEVVLQRNSGYWGKDEDGNQLPYLDQIKITFLKDKKSELTAFQNKEIDLLWNPDVEDLASFVSFAIDSFPSPPQFQLFNCNALSIDYYGFNNSVPPFNNIYVRQAFCYAIDRTKIVDEILKGAGVPADNGFVPPGINGYSGQETFYAYDPEKARALLKKAGFANGKNFPEVTLEINAGAANINSKVADAVVTMLKQNLGVNVRVNLAPFAQHLEELETGRSLFWRSGWIVDYPDPRTFLILAYGKNVPQDPHARSSLNPSRFINKDFDLAFEKAETEKSETTRMDDYHTAEKIAMENAFVCPLYYRTNYLLLGTNVRNYFLNGLDARDLSQVWFSK
ncbi:MAG: peptide ABC transporter substrate-binding protein [Bacteroidetes bacterium]|nr:peptide ABC transporter substrate-binding protein [Bacteroidota bacterium]